MSLVASGELVKRAYKEGYAIPSFTVWSSDTMNTVLGVASDCRAPVMIMCGPGEFELLPAAQMASVAQAVVHHFDIPVALHLDHGDTVELAGKCIQAGFTSVMLDCSHLSLEENAGSVRRVVEMAKPGNITVEGEIGAVGRVDDVTTEGERSSFLTKPDDAAAFLERTGVDMMAVSIGNAHGHYPTAPVLDFDRLSRIRELVDVPLVLHGGSGTPEEDIKRLIRTGIAKINIATELVRALRAEILNYAEDKNPIWLPIALAKSMEQMAPVVEKWINICGVKGKAPG